MAFKLYNSLSHKEEVFKPLKRGQVSIYACGPTVYQAAHIGNLRTYLFEDILRRVLEYNGYQVKHVMNITDVGHLTSDEDSGEDKVELAAKKTGLRATKLTKYYTDLFKRDLRALNIEFPTKFAPATKYIKEQINLVKKLEKNGYTYQTADGIYFNTKKFKHYGRLAKISAGRPRVYHGGEKKSATDFALWKFSAKGEKRQQEWPSPWGVGYPGWHLECSAISTKELSQPFDIHLGGEDHIAIHHNNEIAQSEAAYKKPLAKYFVHGAFLLVHPFWNVTLRNNIHQCPFCDYKNLIKGRAGYIVKKQADGGWLLMVRCKNCKKVFSGMIKMSKSKGNFLSLVDLEKLGFSPMVFRYLAIAGHYQDSLSFTKSAMEGAQNSLHKLQEIFASKKKGGKLLKKYQSKFLSTINDNLNLPGAMKIVWEVAGSKASLADKQVTLLDFDKVLGLGLKNYKPTTIPAKIKKLAEERQRARNKKNWAESDRLRKEIEYLGYEILDTESSYLLKPKL